MKMFLQSLIAIILIVGGVYVMYLYISSINTKSNILLLIGSIGMLGIGVFFLVRAGKADTIILNRTQSTETDTTSLLTQTDTAAGVGGQLQKNNAMLADWKKTNETKDRLRMLEMQASADAQDS